MTPLRKRMTEELQLRNLSATTVFTYVRSVERFAKYFRQSPEMLGAEHVRDYLLHLKNDRKVQTNTILVNRSALRFLYVSTLKQTWFDDQVPMPKRRPGLPGQLSAEEITRILDHTTNLKHWTIIATFYATALRCDELRNLKVGDIDSKRMVIFVRQAKGVSFVRFRCRPLSVAKTSSEPTQRCTVRRQPFHGRRRLYSRRATDGA